MLLKVNGGEVTPELAAAVMAATAPARAAGIRTEAGGVLGVQLSAQKSRRSEAIGLIAGVVILAVTFGTLVAAGMPIITAMVALLVGLGLIGFLGYVVDIPVVGPTLATMLGLGVGIDYALFIVFRFRDELHGGTPVGEAVARAMATSGSAVVFAGTTVIIALLSLLVARVPILGAMGYSSALAVLVAVLTAITFLPAVLGLVGRRIDALRLPWRRGATEAVRGGQRLVAVGRRRDAAPLGVAHRGAGRDAAAGGADAHAHPGPGGHRRLADVVDPAPRLRPHLGRLRTRAPTAGCWWPRRSRRRPSPARRTRRRRTRPSGWPRGWRRTPSGWSGGARRSSAAATGSRPDKAALERQAAALKTQQAQLQAQAAPLLARKDALLAQQQKLLARKQRLQAQGAALQAQAAALQKQGAALAAQAQQLGAQIAAVQAQMAQTTDPVELQKLQAQLASLAAQLQGVQKQLAAGPGPGRRGCRSRRPRCRSRARPSPPRVASWRRPARPCRPTRPR